MALVDLNIKLEVLDELTVGRAGYSARRHWTPVGTVGKTEDVTIAASSFQALSPPAGSHFVVIDVGATTSLTLKGLTGDAGVKITPATNPLNLPVLLPLGASPSIGLANGEAFDQEVSLIWL